MKIDYQLLFSNKSFFYIILFIIIFLYIFLATKIYIKIPLRNDEIISLLAVKSLNKENIIPLLPSNNKYLIYLFNTYVSKLFSFFLKDDKSIIRLPNIFLHSISAILLYFLIIKIIEQNLNNNYLSNIGGLLAVIIFLFDITFFYFSLDGRCYEAIILFTIIFLNIVLKNTNIKYIFWYLIISGFLVSPFFFLLLLSFLIIRFILQKKIKYQYILYIIFSLIIFFSYVFLASNEKVLNKIFKYLTNYFIINNPLYYLKYSIINYPALIVFFIIYFFSKKQLLYDYELFFSFFLIYFLFSFTILKHTRILHIISPLIILFVIKKIVLSKNLKIILAFIIILLLTNYIKYKMEYFYFYDPYRINFDKIKMIDDNNITDYLTTNSLICYYYKPNKNITMIRKKYSDKIQEKKIKECYYTGAKIISEEKEVVEYFNTHKNFIFLGLQKDFFNNNIISEEIRTKIMKEMRYLAEFSTPKYFVFIKE